MISYHVVKHDHVIKWKHFPRYWPFVRGIHRSPVNSPQQSQWRGALMFSLISTGTNGWVNNRDVGDLRRHWTHCNITVMFLQLIWRSSTRRWNPQVPMSKWVAGPWFKAHWGRDEIDAISQMTSSNAFSWMKMNEFRLGFHWSLFLRFELTIFHHWFR